jgi:hypothetical protein
MGAGITDGRDEVIGTLVAISDEGRASPRGLLDEQPGNTGRGS